MPVFFQGQAKTAKARITVSPSGLSCSAELWLSKDGTTKQATSGGKTFTSTGAPQDVSLPVTMPSGGWQYGVYLDVYVAGNLMGAYRGTEDVLIPSVSDPIITW
ncbi:MAG: hypothetical protein U1D67_10630 [Dehalococcoidia bacterium]|nr:hypothetical protein [Dehalococcoidia bacterium]